MFVNVRSNGWNMWVMLSWTSMSRMFRCCCKEVTSYVVWQWKTSTMRRVAWCGFAKSWCCFLTNGTKISVITLIDSCLLLWCLVLALRQKKSGNLNLGTLCTVFPTYITCTRRNYPPRVTMNVPVMLLLSADLMMRMTLKNFSPFHGALLGYISMGFDLSSSQGC